MQLRLMGGERGEPEGGEGRQGERKEVLGGIYETLEQGGSFAATGLMCCSRGSARQTRLARRTAPEPSSCPFGRDPAPVTGQTAGADQSQRWGAEVGGRLAATLAAGGAWGVQGAQRPLVLSEGASLGASGCCWVSTLRYCHLFSLCSLLLAAKIFSASQLPTSLYFHPTSTPRRRW